MTLLRASLRLSAAPCETPERYTSDIAAHARQFLQSAAHCFATRSVRIMEREMAGVQDDEREDYVVRVVEFAADTASAVRALQRVFGLSDADAQTMVREAPVAVKRGVNRIRAEYFRRALELSGARVEVENGEGAVVAVAAPNAAASAPNVAVAALPLMAAGAGANQPAGPVARVVAPPPAADPAPRVPARQPSGPVSPYGKTLMLGSAPAPANDTRPKPAAAPAPAEIAAAAPALANDTKPKPAVAPAATGWGDLEPFKKPAAPDAARPQPAAAAPTARDSAPLDRGFDAKSPAPGAFAPGAPREIGANDLAKGALGGAKRPNTGAAAFAPGAPREIGANDLAKGALGGAKGPNVGAGAFAPGGPREISASDIPNAPGLGGAGAFAPGGPREISVMPSSAGPLEISTSLPAAAMRESAAHSPPNLSTSEMPAGPGLELGVEERDMQPFATPARSRDLKSRDRESAPRYDAIPAGERWKAPGSDTLARARRKQAVHSMESGLADPRPSPMPPGARPPASIARNTPGTPLQPVSRPQPKAAAPAASTAEGFGAVTRVVFAGTGGSWIAWISVAGLALAGAAELCRRVPVAGIPVLLVAVAFVLGLCGLYHRHVFWAAATGEDELSVAPSLAVAQLMRSGAALIAFAALLQLLVWARVASEVADGQPAVAILGSPILWVLGFGPGFYWPIALGCAAAHNRFRGIWNVAQGLRALGREPGEIARVALASAIAFAAPLAIITFVLRVAGLEGPAALFAAGGIALALSHGLMGAWSGRLLRVRPDVFE